ncbi:hypothetical protein ABK040_008030 [Willaertia magna]
MIGSNSLSGEEKTTDYILLKDAEGICLFNYETNKFILQPNASLLIHKNKILQIASNNNQEQKQLEQLYNNEIHNNNITIINCKGKYLLPGFINTHVHSAQQLARGLGDDIHLINWLHKRIWPYESNMNERDMYISTKLCLCEQIRNGVTCYADAGGHFLNEMSKAIEEMGIRVVLSQSIMDSGVGLPESSNLEGTSNFSWKLTTQECIELQLENFKKFNGMADDRIKYWFNLRTIFNCSDELIKQTKFYADKLNTGIHMHVAEIKEEVDYCKENRGGLTTVKHLNQLGALGKNLLAVHSVWLDEEELNLYKQHDVKVSHCPAAAMRYLGFAKIPEMSAKGITVSIGTDGAPSNNRMSIIDEAWLANLIHKGRTLNPTVCDSNSILKMITIDGAKCLLSEKEIGTIEVGKKADILIINPNTSNMLPLHCPLSNVITSMNASNIESVMCNGKFVMKDFKIPGEEEILLEARERAKEIVKRANIEL